MAEEEDNKKVFELKKEEELRFEADWDENLEIELLQGKAEIFGTELVANTPYKLPTGTKLPIFTYHGCKIRFCAYKSTDGSIIPLDKSEAIKSIYTASETPMSSYLQLHKNLEEFRDRETNGGPRLMIVGPTDSGKSSLCKLLCNYAIRDVEKQGAKKIIFVDLDIGQNSITIPGTISAVQLSEPISITEGFSLSSPLTYFFGYETPSGNGELYKRLTDKLAESVKSKMQRDSMLKHSGMVINTCGWVEGLGYHLLVHQAKAFSCSHIYVLGDDRLTASLKKDLLSELPQIQIERINKSGGVVNRNSNYRKHTRMMKYREYFYGVDNSLYPHSIVVKFDQIEIVRVGGGLAAPRSALPIGAKSVVDPLELKTIEIEDQKITHSVLGLSHANSREEILQTNICGVVYIEKVDLEKKELHLLSPSPGKLPKKYLIYGELKWLDQV